MAPIGAACSGLVLGEVPGIHDGVTAIVPGASDVGLAVGWVIAATARAASVVETAANLTSRTDGRVGLAPMGDMEIRFISTNSIPLRTTAEALRNELDAAVWHNREIPFRQGNSVQVRETGGRSCRGACDEGDDSGSLEMHCEDNKFGKDD